MVRWLTQVWLPIVCLAGLVGGLTWIRHFYWTPQPAAPASPGVSSPPRPAALELQVVPPDVDLGFLTPQRPRAAASVWCWWSSVRPLPVTASDTQADRWLTTRIVPLDAAGLQELAARLWEEAVPATVGSGCRVEVGASADDAPANLDFGPFRRRVLLRDADGRTAELEVTGVLQGSVQVEGESQEIELGSFPAQQGTRKTIFLAAEAAQPALSLAEVRPEYLRVSLEEVERKGRWRLQVEVPPHRAAGPLPENSAVRIDIPGLARKLRLPVAGTAYR
jgi:hypothetical protein